MYVVQQPGVTLTKTENQSVWDHFIRDTPEQCAQYFIEKSALELSVKDELGYTLLHRACMRGDSLVVASLLRAGVVIDSALTTGVTAVHLAASHGQPIILSMLKHAGADLGQRDTMGQLALHYAAANDRVIAIAWLLHFPEAGKPDSEDYKGRTPLHMACSNNSTNALALMIQASQTIAHLAPCLISTPDDKGNTCMHAPFLHMKDAAKIRSYSISGRTSDVIWTLLTHPASKDQALPLTLVRNHDQETPLDMARRLHVGRAIFLLLILSQYFASRWQPHRPPITCNPLIIIYKFTWVLLALTPFIISLTAQLVCALLRINWPYFLAALLSLFMFVKQRHRMADGTNRPNPFFAGSFCTGFVTTLFAIWHDLFITPDCSWAYSLGYWLVWILAVPLPIIFLYLITTDPGRVPLSNSSQPGLIDLINRESRELQQPIYPIASRSPPIADQYCAPCDLVRSVGDPVKHCKLCNRCMYYMDHHCLFIMRCVAGRNHRGFVLLVFNSLLFLGAYVILTSSAVWTDCRPPSGPPSHQLWHMCSCFYARWALSIVMLLFTTGSFIWGTVLWHDQVVAVATRKPVWLRKSNWLCIPPVRHWRPMFRLMVFGENLVRDSSPRQSNHV